MSDSEYHKCGISTCRKMLDLFGVEYEAKATFADCRYNNEILTFDFYLIDLDKLIECDGFDAKLKQKQNKIKNEYCKKKNIDILRIPYSDIDRIGDIIAVFTQMTD